LSNHRRLINSLSVATSLWLLISLFSCSPLKKELRNLDSNPRFADSFTGFILFDPESSQTLYNHQGNKYFTPASNTKLLTFYLASQILGDSLPAFEYRIQQDTVWLWGTGDPSFLNPDLPYSKVFKFLEGRPIKMVRGRQVEPKYGPGWAWDDYSGSYQREKAAFPIFGNAVHIWYDSISDRSMVNPPVFSDSIDFLAEEISRDMTINHFTISEQWDRSDTVSIPISISDSLLVKLWADTLGSDVRWIENTEPVDSRVMYSIATDSAFKQLLQVSDNFVAEQLILLCSWQLSGELDSKRTLEQLTDSLLTYLPQKPKWVDGSGLSRYNLITPLSLVEILRRIYLEVGITRIKELFPAGGQSGTIKDYYHADPPYIYAKTGTLSNNHCLSGYLRTAKGKWLIFSFMHNHYPGNSDPIKREMERILWQVHRKY